MLLALVLFFGFLPLYATSELYLESGQVQNSYNQVAIPGDSGTRFNLRKSFDQGDFYYRVRYLKLFRNSYGIRLLYAPLKLTGSARFSKDINFQEGLFSAGEPTSTLFKFNSYRMTYFYQFKTDSRWKLRAGATAKIREAAIELRQNDLKKERTDLGFVPLLYFFADYRWQNGVRAAFSLDGLFAPQGRAIDSALMIGRVIEDHFIINLGYRILEGGADNDKVYNFSQFNFFFLSAQLSF